jgi:hypothetical protein
VYRRKKPNYHRRLMFIASCAITAAAFGRFPLLAHKPLIIYPWVDLLIIFGVLRDLLADAKINVIYRYALPLLVAVQAFAIYTLLSFQPIGKPSPALSPHRPPKLPHSTNFGAEVQRSPAPWDRHSCLCAVLSQQACPPPVSSPTSRARFIGRSAPLAPAVAGTPLRFATPFALPRPPLSPKPPVVAGSSEARSGRSS